MTATCAWATQARADALPWNAAECIDGAAQQPVGSSCMTDDGGAGTCQSSTCPAEMEVDGADGSVSYVPASPTACIVCVPGASPTTADGGAVPVTTDSSGCAVSGADADAASLAGIGALASFLLLGRKRRKSS